MFRKPIYLAFVVFGLALGTAHAQWSVQNITLNPGWNSVYLEVQPSPDDCDIVFAGIPVESVWASTRRFSSVQFIQDPSTLLPGDPDWLTYAPADSPARAVRNLFTLQGGRPYLVKLKPGAPATAWSVKGIPVVRSIDWVPNALNFVGLPIGTNVFTPPTFQNYFAGSAAHAGQAIYRLSTAGQWESVGGSGAAMRLGEAYWVYCNGASTFTGPASVTLEQRDGLIYGRTLNEQTIRIRNNATGRRTFIIEEIASAAPPTTATPLLAGRVPLSYYRIDTTNSLFGWAPLTNRLTKELQPNEEWVLRLSVNRPQMANFTPPAQHNGVLYQSLLVVNSGSGLRFVVPVSSEGLRTFEPSGGGQLGVRAVSNGSEPHTGLWIGNATIDAVSQPSNVAAPNTPLPVGAPLQFRLIVHVDSGGQVRLLQKVLEMFRNGTLIPDPEDPNSKIVAEPGRFVLVTDETLTSIFTGSALRDGEPVARRTSSTAFSFKQPILLAGNGAFGAGTFNCLVNLDYDDPMNPFKHRFHPDHDNMDERFQTKVLPGRESFNIIRQLELEFTAQDPDNLTFAGWGDNQLGGKYREVITGLHNKSIHIAGTFRLTRVSRIGVLNDGMQ